MFHMVGYDNQMCLLSVLKLSWDILFEGTDYVYARKTKSICMWGTRERGKCNVVHGRRCYKLRGARCHCMIAYVSLQ